MQFLLKYTRINESVSEQLRNPLILIIYITERSLIYSSLSMEVNRGRIKIGLSYI